MTCDVLIVGGGTGGVAAALALSSTDLKVVLTEETDWIGGQFTSQIVPPDEHPWIERFGCTRNYDALRFMVRAGYKADRQSSMTIGARQDPFINPGGGWVSRLCAEPRHFLRHMKHFVSSCQVCLRTVVVGADVTENKVVEVTVRNLDSGAETRIKPRFVLDATELGDLLPATGTEYVVGAESRSETGEPHAVDGVAQPTNIQSFTWCAAIGFDNNGIHTINKPKDYDKWRDYVPQHWTGKLLDLTFPNVRTGERMALPLFGEGLTLFGYRQIVDPGLYEEATEPVTVMNWPQNDYMDGHVIDVDVDIARSRLESSRQLTLSVLYWLQTEMGFPGLRLRPDITGTQDGLAMAPYHRESRRIRSLRTIKEQDVSPDCHPGRKTAPDMWDSVGIGAYRIDLHPGSDGARTIDISSLPFQIPLGALIPVKTLNLVPCCKNIGTTHITNGCYRLHPVEWTIGEAAGHLAATCLDTGLSPQELYSDQNRVEEFQRHLTQSGFDLRWPEIGPL